MTHLVGLRLTNYQCFRGTTELDLGPGIYAVTAEQEGNAERSNYLGKSALLTAIRYALYGFKPKHFDSLDAMISEGEKELGVDLELSDGTFVSRTKKRGKGTELRVVLPEYDHQYEDARELELYGDEAERQLWQRLGLTPDDLELTAFAAQRQLAALVSAESKTSIADAVTTWLELGKLEAAADHAGQLLREKSQALRLTAAKLGEMTEELKGIDPPSDRAIEDLERQTRDHELRVLRQRELLRDHTAWQQQRAARLHAIVLVVEALATYAHLCTLAPPVDAYSEALKLLANESQSNLARARQAKSDAERLGSSGFDGCCPVNGMQCPATAQINADLDRNRKKLEEARDQYQQAKERDDYAQQQLRVWNADDRRYYNARESVDRATRALRGSHLLAEPLPPEPDISSIVNAESPALELEHLRARQARYDALMNTKAQLETELAEQSAAVKAARAAYAVLGPEGAQQRVAERSIGQIEQGANRELARAGIADLRLSFSWARETQKPAEQCPSCGSAFPRSTTIKQCSACLAPRGLKTEHKPRFRLSRVSGAAEDLAGLALRCAAFEWLRHRRGSTWSIGVLDEPFGALDTYNRRALSVHVQRLLTGTFEQAFVTAHDRLVLDSMPRRILIKSDGRWSTASVLG